MFPWAILEKCEESSSCSTFVIEYRKQPHCWLPVFAFIVSEINLGVSAQNVMYSILPTEIHFINTSA